MWIGDELFKGAGDGEARIDSRMCRVAQVLVKVLALIAGTKPL